APRVAGGDLRRTNCCSPRTASAPRTTSSTRKKQNYRRLNLMRMGLFPPLFTEQELAVNQVQGALRVGPHARVALQVRLARDGFSGGPALAWTAQQHAPEPPRRPQPGRGKEGTHIRHTALPPEPPQLLGGLLVPALLPGGADRCGRRVTHG